MINKLLRSAFVAMLALSFLPAASYAGPEDVKMLKAMLDRYHIICISNDTEKNKELFKTDPDLTRNREAEGIGETIVRDAYFEKHGTEAEITLKESSCSFTLHGMGHLLPALVGQMNGDSRFGNFIRTKTDNTGKSHIYRDRKWEGEAIYYQMEAIALHGEEEDSPGPLIVKVSRILRSGSVDVIDVDDAEWSPLGRLEEGMLGLAGLTYGNMAMIILKGADVYWISFYPVFYPHLAMNDDGIIDRYFFRALAGVGVDGEQLEAFVDCVKASNDENRPKDAPELCVKNEQFFALRLDAAGTKALFSGRKVNIKAITSLNEEFRISLPLKGMREAAKLGELLGSPVPRDNCTPPQHNVTGKKGKKLRAEFNSCMDNHIAMLEDMLSAVTKEQERLMGKRNDPIFSEQLQRKSDELRGSIRSSAVYASSGTRPTGR